MLKITNLTWEPISADEGEVHEVKGCAWGQSNPGPSSFKSWALLLFLSCVGSVTGEVHSSSSISDMYCTRSCLFLSEDLSFWALKIFWNWRVTSGMQVITFGREKLRHCWPHPSCPQCSELLCPASQLHLTPPSDELFCVHWDLEQVSPPRGSHPLSFLHPTTGLGEPSLCFKTLLLIGAQHGAPGHETLRSESKPTIYSA